MVASEVGGKSGECGFPESEEESVPGKRRDQQCEMSLRGQGRGGPKKKKKKVTMDLVTGTHLVTLAGVTSKEPQR